MFNLTISFKLIAAVTLALLIFLFYFLELFFSKKELSIRRHLENDKPPVKEIFKILYKLPTRYFDSLQDQMIDRCTKIFSDYFYREQQIAWIAGIDNIAEIKKRETMHARLVLMTRNAICRIPADELAGRYLQSIMIINEPNYDRQKTNDFFVEEFILKNVLHSSDDCYRQNFLASLKEKMNHRFDDIVGINNIQKKLVEAEIIRIERDFF